MATVHRLSNGLTVYISENRERPEIVSQIVVRAGARHDPDGATGLAHILEHMLFKGTRKLGTTNFVAEKPHLDRVAALIRQLAATKGASRARVWRALESASVQAAAYAAPGDIDRLYARLGITDVDAYTSDDATAYTARMPADVLASWARIEGERFSDPQFRLFLHELETVYEEKNQSLADPDARVFKALSRALFPTHPYGTRTALGSAEHLLTPSHDRMVRFFREWYVADNMAIVLAGDVSADTALPILERHFSGLPTGPVRELERGVGQGADGRVQAEVVAPGDEQLYLAWRTVSSAHPERAAIAVLDRLLVGRHGLLAEDITAERHSMDIALREGGVWILRSRAPKQRHAAVERAVLQAVRRAKTGAFSQDALRAAALRVEVDFLRGWEDNLFRTQFLTDAYVSGRRWDGTMSWPARVRAVTKSDVIRVARKYFGRDRAVVRRLDGAYNPARLERPVLAPLSFEGIRESAFARRIRAPGAESSPPPGLREGVDYTTHALPAGPLIAVPNHKSRLFAVAYRFAVGYQHHALACFAVRALDKSGGQLHKRLAVLGALVSLRCTSTEIRVDIEGLDRHMEKTMALVTRWLMSPSVDPRALREHRAAALRTRVARRNEPSVLRDALSMYALRGQDSDYLRLPSTKQIQRASAEELASWLGRLPTTQHRTSYFGPRAGTEVAVTIALGDSHQPPPPSPPRRYRRPSQPTVYWLKRSFGNDSAVVLWAADAKDRLRTREPLRVLAQYLSGGMSGLLYQQLREGRGLAYTARAEMLLNARRGDDVAFVAGVETQPAKLCDALQVLRRVVTKPTWSESQFAIAKAARRRKLRARLSARDVADTLYAWGALGWEGDPRFRQLSSGEHQSLDDVVQGLVAIVRSPMTVAMMAQGTLCKAVNAGYRVVELTVDDIVR